MHHRHHNGQTMTRWLCCVTTKDQVSSQDLLDRMLLDSLGKVRPRWHGHVKRNDCWLKKV